MPTQQEIDDYEEAVLLYRTNAGYGNDLTMAQNFHTAIKLLLAYPSRMTFGRSNPEDIQFDKSTLAGLLPRVEQDIKTLTRRSAGSGGGYRYGVLEMDRYRRPRW